MYYTVYKVTNKVNGKYYIGKHQTVLLTDSYMGSGKLLRRAIQKYGSHNFMKEILYTFDNEADMNAKEAELVVVSEDTYNLCDGGRGGFSYINRNGLQALKNPLTWEKTNQSRRKNNPNFYYEFMKAGHAALIKKYGSLGNQKFGKQFGHLGNTPEARSKARATQKSTFKKIRHQQGTKNSQHGTFWITNGKENKKCRGAIPEGYRKGRIIPIDPSMVNGPAC